MQLRSSSSEEKRRVSRGLMSHSTLYRSFRGRFFTGQKTQPTATKHWRKPTKIGFYLIREVKRYKGEKCHVADHPSIYNVCQILPKSVTVCRNYSKMKVLVFLETQCIALFKKLINTTCKHVRKGLTSHSTHYFGDSKFACNVRSRLLNAASKIVMQGVI